MPLLIIIYMCELCECMHRVWYTTTPAPLPCTSSLIPLTHYLLQQLPPLPFLVAVVLSAVWLPDRPVSHIFLRPLPAFLFGPTYMSINRPILSCQKQKTNLYLCTEYTYIFIYPFHSLSSSLSLCFVILRSVLSYQKNTNMYI